MVISSSAKALRLGINHKYDSFLYLFKGFNNIRIVSDLKMHVRAAIASTISFYRKRRMTFLMSLIIKYTGGDGNKIKHLLRYS